MVKHMRKSIKFRHRVIALCLPGFAGFILFFIYPAIKSFYYSLMDNTHTKRFIFLDNYKRVLTNKYFQLALTNTALFSLIGVTLILTLSLAIAFSLIKAKGKNGLIKRSFILPMLLPTAGVIAAWHYFFNNDYYFNLMKTSGFLAALPIYLLYIWKNTGINIIIITAAASGIPQEIYEAASLDGAGGLTVFRKVTIPCIRPAIFFAGVLSLVNSLKIFKESYLFFGSSYPPDSVYTLQYYMNNHFLKLNYPILASAMVVFTTLISVIIILLYIIENKISRDIY